MEVCGIKHFELYFIIQFCLMVNYSISFFIF